MGTAMERVLQLAQKQSVIRGKDLNALGIPRNYLLRLMRDGKLERVCRGLYSSPQASATEHRTLVEVCKKVPQAVICLSSALRFHELTTENPSQVWIAMKRDTWRPRVNYPPMRVVTFSGEAFDFGITVHTVEGGQIPVYSPAKTVADCFKFKSKVGTELAIQALRGSIPASKGDDRRTLEGDEGLPYGKRDASLYGIALVTKEIKNLAASLGAQIVSVGDLFLNQQPYQQMR